MATGRLGAADLSAATNTTLYTVPATTFTVATVSLCNRSSSAVTVESLSAQTRPQQMLSILNMIPVCLQKVFWKELV